MKLKQMPENMAEYPVDLAHPNRTLISGLFEENVDTADGKRRFYTYIPENLENCSPCLVAAIPAVADPETYIDQSGLAAFADENRLFLFLAVSEGNHWKTDGSDAEYLNAVYVAVQGRDYYVTMQDNIYLCGIEDGAYVAQQAAVQMSSEWSALISLGDITGEIGVSGQKTVAKEQGDVELAVEARQSQLPVWMLISEETENNKKAIEYWKKQNGTTEEELSGAGCDHIWMPDNVRKYNEINNEETSQVRVKIAGTAFDAGHLRLAWEFAKRTRRHRSVAGKALRNYKDPIVCGAEIHTMEVDGMVRTWYEYVPKSCTPDQKWPVVVVMHGRGGSAETFFDLSGMSVVAEERQFIAVFPQAGIHQQKKDGLKNILLWCGSYQDKPINDVTFIRAMLEDIEGRLPVDPERRYACGQSSGGMMSDLLGYTAGDLFAAVAPWSALRSPKRMFGSYEKGKLFTPTMFLYGDRDFLSAGTEPDAEFPFSLSAEVKEIVKEKLEELGIAADDYQTWRNAPIIWYTYCNRQGIPLVVVGKVSNMVHANYPEESWISYDQFLSRFKRGKDGTLYYGGKKVTFDK